MAPTNQPGKLRRLIASPTITIGFLAAAAIGTAWVAGDALESRVAEPLWFEVRNTAPARVTSVDVSGDEIYLIIDEGSFTFSVIAPSRTGAFAAGDHVAVGVGRRVAAAEAPAFFARELPVIHTDEVAVVTAERAAELARVEPAVPGLGIAELHAQHHSFAGGSRMMAGRTATRLARGDEAPPFCTAVMLQELAGTAPSRGTYS